MHTTLSRRSLLASATRLSCLGGAAPFALSLADKLDRGSIYPVLSTRTHIDTTTEIHVQLPPGRAD